MMFHCEVWTSVTRQTTIHQLFLQSSLFSITAFIIRYYFNICGFDILKKKHNPVISVTDSTFHRINDVMAEIWYYKNPDFHTTEIESQSPDLICELASIYEFDFEQAVYELKTELVVSERDAKMLLFTCFEVSLCTFVIYNNHEVLHLSDNNATRTLRKV